MTDIYLVNQIWYTCEIRKEVLYQILIDDFIKPDDYIPLPGEELGTVYIRKKDIVSFNEHLETEEA